MLISRHVVNLTHWEGPLKSQLIETNRQTYFLLKNTQNIWAYGPMGYNHCFLFHIMAYCYFKNISLLFSELKINRGLSFVFIIARRLYPLIYFQFVFCSFLYQFAWISCQSRPSDNYMLVGFQKLLWNFAIVQLLTC